MVLAVIYTVRMDYPWSLRLALVAGSAMTGLVFNTIRIVAISLASLYTMLDYGMIHEGLGSIIYLAALGLVYAVLVLTSRHRQRQTEQVKSAAHEAGHENGG